jgi:hypothetical protein
MKKSAKATQPAVSTPTAVTAENTGVIGEYMMLKSRIKSLRSELKASLAKRKELETKVEAAMNLPGGYRLRILNPKKMK